MKLLVGYFMLALALTISSVAAYFSVVGLAALFAATATAVVVMGLALEAGKLATASWIHSNWKNPKVKWPLRSYLVVAVVALMLITSLGIYGFLAKGHLEQSAPLAPVELEIANKQADIDAAKADLESQKQRLAQLDAAVNSMIGVDKAERGLRYRRSQSAERAEIQRAIQADTAKIQSISKELVPLKLQVNDVETKLGPVKYVAELFGIKDSEAAVRIVILVIMFAFDPLAVVMVLAAFISISDGLDERRQAKSTRRVLELGKPNPDGLSLDELMDKWNEEDQTAPRDDSVGPPFAVDEPTPVIEPEKITTPTEANIAPEEAERGNILVELENASSERTKKEILLSILESEPELLQEIVEVIKEEKPSENPKPQDGFNEHWLDSDNPK
jgi:hypothetical protein